MILLYDNYDSFTYNLLDYLLQCGTEVRVVRNDRCDPEDVLRLNPEGIVFSPGPSRPEESGNMMELIRLFHDKYPILGVCLGHQALGLCFGARLVHAETPMHGKTSVAFHSGHPMFRGIPREIKVMRYHSLILEEPDPAHWEVAAITGNGEIMAMAHRRFRLWGMQFHPESVLTEHGFRMLENWLNFVRAPDFEANAALC